MDSQTLASDCLGGRKLAVDCLRRLMGGRSTNPYVTQPDCLEVMAIPPDDCDITIATALPDYSRLVAVRLLRRQSSG